jgi:hypothetical protein
MKVDNVYTRREGADVFGVQGWILLFELRQVVFHLALVLAASVNTYGVLLTGRHIHCDSGSKLDRPLIALSGAEHGSEIGDSLLKDCGVLGHYLQLSFEASCLLPILHCLVLVAGNKGSELVPFLVKLFLLSNNSLLVFFHLLRLWLPACFVLEHLP